MMSEFGIISRLEWAEVQMYVCSPSIDLWQELMAVGPKLVLAIFRDSGS